MSITVKQVIQDSVSRMFVANLEAINLILQQTIAKDHYIPLEPYLFPRKVTIITDENTGILITNDKEDYEANIIFHTGNRNVRYVYTEYNTGISKSYNVRYLSSALESYRKWLEHMEEKYEYDLWANIDPEDINEMNTAMSDFVFGLRDPRIDIIIMNTKRAIDDYDGALRLLRNSAFINHALDNVRTAFARLRQIKSEKNTPASNEEVFQIEDMLNQNVAEIISAISTELAYATPASRFGISIRRHLATRTRKAPVKSKSIRKARKSIKRSTRKSPAKPKARKSKTKKTLRSRRK